MEERGKDMRRNQTRKKLARPVRHHVRGPALPRRPSFSSPCVAARRGRYRLRLHLPPPPDSYSPPPNPGRHPRLSTQSPESHRIPATSRAAPRRGPQAPAPRPAAGPLAAASPTPAPTHRPPRAQVRVLPPLPVRPASRSRLPFWSGNQLLRFHLAAYAEIELGVRA
jgi:hypothetical protein